MNTPGGEQEKVAFFTREVDETGRSYPKLDTDLSTWRPTLDTDIDYSADTRLSLLYKQFETGRSQGDDDAFVIDESDIALSESAEEGDPASTGEPSERVGAEQVRAASAEPDTEGNSSSAPTTGGNRNEEEDDYQSGSAPAPDDNDETTMIIADIFQDQARVSIFSRIWIAIWLRVSRPKETR